MSEKEFLSAMVQITAHTPDEQFEAAIKDLLSRSKKSMKGDYYFHSAGNRDYLGADVLPLVRKGLEELMVRRC